ncbi:MAG: ABC transporter permease [Myxococcales bacterium]|nr:ABC transporter permease [Myxococcales bacterium]
MTGAFQRALRGLREHTYLAAVATGVIAAALVLLGVYALVVVNLQSALSGWQKDVHVSAYFNAEVSPADQVTARDAIATRAEVASVELITAPMAAAWMSARVPEVGPLLVELGESALPASLEVTLRPISTSPAAMDGFAESLRATGQFAEIDYGREWVERAAAFLATLSLLGGVLGVILVVAALFLVGNTIHLVVYARRDELEILRLVGATESYILTPFLIEGCLQGLIASTVAVATLQMVHHGVVLRLHETVPTAFGGQDLAFLPGSILFGLVTTGITIGVLAGWVAVRRFLARLA